ncbi:MAG: 30S ribosomal protein S15 [Candidatus Aenigmarchaeota archaeon]|nr:30S ribosomal protein S15 [Candidatus Aenigmarchaeota archaeon]
MARMHSRKKGKSGSKKPIRKTAKWVEYKPKEIEDLVYKFANKGITSAKIGTILRDQYGIPSVKLVTKKTVGQIMKEKDVYPKLPEDMFNLIKKAVNLMEHMDSNKRDYTSYRGLEETQSKIRRLAKYYIKRGVLPKTWKYDPEHAKLLIR